MEAENEPTVPTGWQCTIKDIKGKVQDAVFTLMIVSFLLSDPRRIDTINNVLFVVMDTAGCFGKLQVSKSNKALVKTLAPGMQPLMGECRRRLLLSFQLQVARCKVLRFRVKTWCA